MSIETGTALTGLSARELAARIAAGELSAVEVVEAHIQRIEAVNARLNAVVVTRYDEARAEARAADERRARGEPLGPLHGVPITIKESLDLAGTPATFGIPARKRILATSDDPYVARLRAAGAIVLGKTNVPQLLLYIESDSPAYGRTNNPWNLARAVGGSSGGQAAILAAGGTPLGLGTDLGGSLRFPATFCGVAGLKPTAGRLPDPGQFSSHIGQRAIVSQVGPMARRVADVLLGLEVLNGGRNPEVEPPMPLGDPDAVEVARLRVAYFTDDGTFAVAPAVRRAVVEAAGMLAGLGARVTEWRPPEVARARDLWLAVIAADGGRHFTRILRGSKKDPRIANNLLLARRSRPTLFVLRGVMRLAGQRGLAGLTRTMGHRDTLHYYELVEAQADYQRQFASALDRDEGGPFDVILSPAAPVPAIRHGGSRFLATAGGYTVLYNVLGYPAGVVPVTRVRPGEEGPRKSSLDLMQRAARQAELGSVGLPIG
ncbi:MAG TPA: amidase family protein, partial [Ktedonobacterales bacterium]